MRRPALAALILIGLACSALAHRLDEYLQATTISVTRDQALLELRLTPGVSVARKVLADIDTNRDGILSPAEQRAYAMAVRQDLLLTLDGHALPLPLTLTQLGFPPVAAMRDGGGDIVLDFQAALPVGGSQHSLNFENRHQRDISVYLVNTLVPEDKTIHVTGQTRTLTQSVYRLDFTTSTNPSTAPQSSHDSGWSTVATFFGPGVHHILTGFDHLLFVAALVLGAATLWDLVKVVTAFTVAHSLTLTLAALNLVHLPSAVVEPVIAGSIVFVAVQNIFWLDQSHGASRLSVAFLFGLFHGLGFAGGLLDIMHQMPRETIYLAILGFSLGVETGNQMVLLPLFGLLKLVPATRTQLTATVRRFGSAAISLAGSYYFCLALSGSV